MYDLIVYIPCTVQYSTCTVNLCTLCTVSVLYQQYRYQSVIVPDIIASQSVCCNNSGCFPKPVQYCIALLGMSSDSTAVCTHLTGHSLLTQRVKDRVQCASGLAQCNCLHIHILYRLKSFLFNLFTLGILYFFQSPMRDYFQ